MPGAETDPLREQIQAIASVVDTTVILEAEEVRDPMLNMIRDAMIMGSTPEQAITEVVDRIASAGGKVLELLDFPPHATHGYLLKKRLEAAELTPEDMDGAISFLQTSGQIGAISGWWFKKPQPKVHPESLTDDDIDWLLGDGRFSQ